MYRKAEELLKVCQEKSISICQATIDHEIEIKGTELEDLMETFGNMYDVMKDSTTNGLEKETYTLSGITGGNAKKVNDYLKSGKSLSDSFHLEAMARALSVLEVNGAMGKIVATPTAGAAGILPAALVTMQNRFNYSDEEMVKAMITAAAIGGIVASNATISGAEGGCQAETGSASAMTAAALVELRGGSPEESIHAASFAIIHVLGLVCDPIGGLVEFPCALRNASGVSNAIISADLAMAGVKSIIPFDEIVDAMYSVGTALPESLRETALGGLAATPTGCTFCSFL